MSRPRQAGGGQSRYTLALLQRNTLALRSPSVHHSLRGCRGAPRGTSTGKSLRRAWNPLFLAKKRHTSRIRSQDPPHGG
jgi:hypothetical protein